MDLLSLPYIFYLLLGQFAVTIFLCNKISNYLTYSAVNTCDALLSW